MSSKSEDVKDPVTIVEQRISEILKGELGRDERTQKLFFTSGYLVALYDAGVISEASWQRLDQDLSGADNEAYRSENCTVI